MEEISLVKLILRLIPQKCIHLTKIVYMLWTKNEK